MEAARQILSVLLVFALLGGSLWLLRRRGAVSWPRSKGLPKSLQSVQRLALTPQHSLHLVRINGREVVVATHPQGCTVIEPERGA